MMMANLHGRWTDATLEKCCWQVLIESSSSSYTSSKHAWIQSLLSSVQEESLWHLHAVEQESFLLLFHLVLLANWAETIICDGHLALVVFIHGATHDHLGHIHFFQKSVQI